MFTRLQTDPVSDTAGESRDRIHGLGGAERQVIEAERVRSMLARGSRVGLRERLSHGATGDRRPTTPIGRGVAG